MEITFQMWLHTVVGCISTDELEFEVNIFSETPEHTSTTLYWVCQERFRFFFSVLLVKPTF